VVLLTKNRQGKPLREEETILVRNIKDQFNNKRTTFDFSHLDSLN
jgi:hypothetical protein